MPLEVDIVWMRHDEAIFESRQVEFIQIAYVLNDNILMILFHK